jgi:hypothetical protein
MDVGTPWANATAVTSTSTTESALNRDTNIRILERVRKASLMVNLVICLLSHKIAKLSTNRCRTYGLRLLIGSNTGKVHSLRKFNRCYVVSVTYADIRSRFEKQLDHLHIPSSNS